MRSSLRSSCSNVGREFDVSVGLTASTRGSSGEREIFMIYSSFSEWTISVGFQPGKTGDSILTTSGFYGVVIGVEDDTVIVEFGNNKNCRIPMKKAAIQEIEKAKTEA